ncbi:PAS domain S-box protein [soil metagenome]
MAESNADVSANHDLFENAFHHAPIGMALVGLDGGFLRLNRAFCEIVGYPEAELLALNFQAITHPDDLNADLGHLTRLLAGGIPSYQMDKRYLHRNGTLVWVRLSVSLVYDADGAPRNFVSQIEDLTAHREAQAALAQAEARFRLMAENATDMIVTTNLEGAITFAAPSSRVITGYDSQALIGVRPMDLTHPDDAEQVLRVFTNVAQGRAGEAVRWRVWHQHEARWVWLESNPSLLHPDRPAHEQLFLDVIRDVTAQVAQETALEEATLAAHAAAAAKAEFLANMSHEIRTPLTAILGFSGLLADRPGLDEIARGHVVRVVSAGQALLSIVNDVLDFSKLEAGQYEIKTHPASPVDVAHDALLMFAPQAAAKGLSLDFRTDGEIPDFLELDSDRLRQILINLVGNALKFTEQGSVQVRLVYDEDLQHLHVAVADTGAGLTAEQQAGLFQRFAQVDASSTRRHGGTGLGLAICKGLAEAMGGEIGVSGAPGQGATFAFFITAPLSLAVEPAAEADGFAPALDGIRVLVVDDNPMNRELARAVLESVGAEVTEACDGRQALVTATELAFDLILLDIRMPGMDGPATLKRLRAEPGPNTAIPVLAFSADTDLERYTAEDGFDDIVRKPLNALGLIQAIAHWTRWEPVPDAGEDAALG